MGFVQQFNLFFEIQFATILVLGNLYVFCKKSMTFFIRIGLNVLDGIFHKMVDKNGIHEWKARVRFSEGSFRNPFEMSPVSFVTACLQYYFIYFCFFFQPSILPLLILSWIWGDIFTHLLIIYFYFYFLFITLHEENCLAFHFYRFIKLMVFSENFCFF